MVMCFVDDEKAKVRLFPSLKSSNKPSYSLVNPKNIDSSRDSFLVPLSSYTKGEKANKKYEIDKGKSFPLYGPAMCTGEWKENYSSFKCNRQELLKELKKRQMKSKSSFY